MRGNRPERKVITLSTEEADATSWVQVPSWEKPGQEAGKARRSERAGAMSSDKPDEDPGANRRAASIERQASLVNTNLEAEPPAHWRKQHPDKRNLVETAREFQRGKGGSTSRRDASELEKPSGSRGERPRKKVSLGNRDEDPRVAAGRVVVENHR